jgi:tetratricopeptide (TPR) repeat protein
MRRYALLSKGMVTTLVELEDAAPAITVKTHAVLVEKNDAVEITPAGKKPVTVRALVDAKADGSFIRYEAGGVVRDNGTLPCLDEKLNFVSFFINAGELRPRQEILDGDLPLILKYADKKGLLNIMEQLKIRGSVSFMNRLISSAWVKADDGDRVKMFSLISRTNTEGLDKGVDFYLYQKGLVLAKLGRHEEAITAYEEAIHVNRKDANYHNECGRAYYKVNNYEKALAYADKAIALKSDFSDAYNNKGNVLYSSGKYQEAVAAYTMSIEIAPNAVKYRNRANAYKGLKLADKAAADEAAAAQMERH